MIRHGRLNIPIIGVAKSNWSRDQLIARAKDSLEQNGGIHEPSYEKLCSLLQYIDGDYTQISTFEQLRELRMNFKAPIYYLAIPPSLFGIVAEGLAKTGGASGARVVVEKPFGRDLASAQDLNRILSEFFPEDAIYRIDHFLGKESIKI